MKNITKLVWALEAWEDYIYWLKKDKAKVKRINALIKDALRDPLSGIGKPEKLKYLTDTWSRRINIEHRLVYQVKGNALCVLQCRYHYDN